MNYIMLDGKKIPLSKETEENLRQSQRDYEILSFMNEGQLYEKVADSRLYLPDSKFSHYALSYDELIKTATIHSVRRLSDGEVFTVGDEVEHWVSKLDRVHKWKIGSFKVVDGVMLVYSGTGFKMPLDLIAKRQKKPIFQTFDGKDIYEGDKCCFVAKDDNYRLLTYGAVYSKAVSTMIPFSTKEKAEQWIEDNKPRYSKKDIREAGKSHAVSAKFYQICELLTQLEYEKTK